MKTLLGNIYDPLSGTFIKGVISFDKYILKIEVQEHNSECYILPGWVDAHIHIESSMLSPVEYSIQALRHGVIGAVADPHEIANVCGIEGLEYMLSDAEKTPMKISFGIPSCVPATPFETSGAVLDAKIIDYLFETGKFSHLCEMMNFPGVIQGDHEVHAKIKIAKKYKKKIDGHAPMLSGEALKKYIEYGIDTDHECVSYQEALEKVRLGMKVMLRSSSIAKDYKKMLQLIGEYEDQVLFCTDDFHPDDLQKGYINLLVKETLQSGFSIKKTIKTASLNAIKHYNLPIGKLQVGDFADFIVVDDMNQMNVLKTFINGKEVWDGKTVHVNTSKKQSVNQFFINTITLNDIIIPREGSKINVIEVIPNSLLTNHLIIDIDTKKAIIESNQNYDLLKIVVLNRYRKANPTVGFIRGFNLKNCAFGSTIAHDSHNIIVVGTTDDFIIKAINLIQKSEGGLAFVSDRVEHILPLPIAGLMSNCSCKEVIEKYNLIIAGLIEHGCDLESHYMSLGFMSLLVIPSLKISDKGLFSVDQFKFIPLQF